MKGRKPTPKEEKAPSAPKPPSDLPAAAKAEWTRLVNLLQPMHVLSELDQAALTIYSTSIALYRDAQRHLDVEGCVIDIGRKREKSPWLTVQKECWDRIRVLLTELSLTPTARARLISNESKQEQPIVY